MIGEPAESNRIIDKPRGRGTNPRSLANLRPAKKGEVRNPNGRPSAGASVKEFLNQMQDMTLDEIGKIATDPKQPVNRIAAARLWLGACADTDDLDMLMDRTVGKPSQAVDVTSGGMTIQVVREQYANRTN